MDLRTRVFGGFLAVSGITILVLALGYDLVGGQQFRLGAAQLVGAVLALAMAVAGGFLMRHDGIVRIDSASMFLMALSALFALLVGEIVTRYLQDAWPFDKEVVNAQALPPDELVLRWHFYPKADLSGYASTDESDSGCRVLLLGDSVVTGLDMEAIERHLGSVNDDTETSVSLFMMGNGGHTTYQELEFLRIIGLELHPKLVVLGIVINDVYYKYLHRPTKSRFLDAEPSARLHRFNTNRFPGVLLARSYLAHHLAFTTQLLWTRLSGYPDFYFERQVDAYLAWKPYGWDETGELLAEMQQLVSDAGGELAAVIFPTIYQSNEAYLRADEEYVMAPITAARRILEARQIPYLDLTEPVYTNGGVELFEDWVHLSKEGHRIVAKDIADFVKSRLSLGLCEPPAPSTR